MKRTASKRFVAITSNSHQVTILIFTLCNLIVDSTCKLCGYRLRENDSNGRTLPIAIPQGGPHLPKLLFLRALMFRPPSSASMWDDRSDRVDEYAVCGLLCKTCNFPVYQHIYPAWHTPPFIPSAALCAGVSLLILRRQPYSSPSCFL